MTPDWQKDWTSYEAYAAQLDSPFSGRYAAQRFDYTHPVRLQAEVPRRLRKPYPVSIAYTEWGATQSPLVICAGGVANCAHRFHFLASQLCHDYRVICLDWVGRGRSGWLADKNEYTLETYVEQMRQTLLHLGACKATIIGSSLGGTIAIVLAARYPHLAGRLILNDTGPFIPAARRKRRAETLARHYVFRTPSDMLRKVGVAQRNDGPIGEDVRLYTTYHQTRWSAADDGRIYRHDPRALMAFREQARQNVNTWSFWRQLHQPVLVMHGMESDVLLPPTLRRMMQRQNLTVIHIPDTGHTPVLDNPDHIHMIRTWLTDNPETPLLGHALSALRRPS